MSSIQTRKLSLEHRPGLATELGVGNVHAVPLITKVSINVGLGQARQDKNAVAYITASLAKITGQKPVPQFNCRVQAASGGSSRHPCDAPSGEDVRFS